MTVVGTGEALLTWGHVMCPELTSCRLSFPATLSLSPTATVGVGVGGSAYAGLWRLEGPIES